MDKAKRSKNFTPNEKMRLVDLVTSSQVILSKATGGPNYATIVKSKEAAWNDIVLDFNSGSSSNRSLLALKKAWDNIKREARTQRASIRCQVFKTGGGPSEDIEDPVLRKVEAAIGLTSSGLVNPFDSHGPAVQDDGQEASTSQEEVVQPTQSEETAEWTMDEDPVFILPDSPAMPVAPTVRSAIPRKSFKRRPCMSKSTKDLLFTDLQDVATTQLEVERVTLNTQTENLQILKAQSILQSDLLTMQIAQVKLQMEILDAERVTKAALSDIQLRILNEDREHRAAQRVTEAARSEIRWEIQLDILKLQRKAQEAVTKKLQSECP